MSLLPVSHHHAVLLVHDNRVPYGDTLWEELNATSPAHRFFNQTVLDIDTARSIIQWANTPYSEEKIALISFHTASIPAQNAMLKILEEPRSGVRFIILTSNKESLINTVTSRLHYEETKKTNSEETLLAEKFLRTPSPSRMKLPEIIALLASTDEEGRKDRESMRIFILSLADPVLISHFPSHYVQEILETASFASDPSASGKTLIEYLALLLPETKV
jgi:hypothetical protein